MKRVRSKWLLGVALVAGLVAPPLAFAQDSAPAAPQPAAPVEQPVEIRSLSGSILAARVAEADDDLASAITYYKRALIYDSSNNSIKQSLLLALIAEGRFDESLPYAEQLKAVPEAERFSRLALAVDAIRKKEYNKVEHLMKLTLQSDVDSLISGIVTAWAKYGAGDAKGAAKYLQDLQGPEWFGLFTSYHQALIEEAAGDKTAAEETYSLAIDNIAAASTAPGTYLRLAEAYTGFLARQDKKQAALAALDKADEFAPGRLPLQALRKLVNEDKPVEPLAANPSQGVAEILFNVGSALDRDGGEPLVRVYLNYALALEPHDDLALMQLAETAETKRQAQKAIDYYRRVPEASAFRRISEMQIGLNLADLDKQDEAVAQLKKLIADDPKDMRAYLGLGSVYAAKENYKAAAENYDVAVTQIDKPTREHWNVFYQRGIAYERIKEWDKAEPNFKKALELFPDQPQVLNYLGYSWIDKDMNLEEGLDLIRKAVELRPSDGYIVDSLGWAFYKLGRYPEAVTELERAVSLRPEDPVLNDHLGDAYWRVGRQLEATFQWRHARDMKPEPDVLATVEKKLKEGLPDAPAQKAAQGATPAPAPATPKPEVAPDKRTDAPAPVPGQAATPAPAAPAVPATPTEAVAPAPADPAPAQAATPEPAPAEPAAPELAPTPARYTVQRGQSLWSIAAEKLGNGERYIEIIRLNPALRNPARLVPGLEITLPGS